MECSECAIHQGHHAKDDQKSFHVSEFDSAAAELFCILLVVGVLLAPSRWGTVAAQSSHDFNTGRERGQIQHRDELVMLITASRGAQTTALFSFPAGYLLDAPITPGGRTESNATIQTQQLNCQNWVSIFRPRTLWKSPPPSLRSFDSYLDVSVRVRRNAQEICELLPLPCVSSLPPRLGWPAHRLQTVPRRHKP